MLGKTQSLLKPSYDNFSFFNKKRKKVFLFPILFGFLGIFVVLMLAISMFKIEAQNQTKTIITQAEKSVSESSSLYSKLINNPIPDPITFNKLLDVNTPLSELLASSYLLNLKNEQTLSNKNSQKIKEIDSIYFENVRQRINFLHKSEKLDCLSLNFFCNSLEKQQEISDNYIVSRVEENIKRILIIDSILIEKQKVLLEQSLKILPTDKFLDIYIKTHQKK